MEVVICISDDSDTEEKEPMNVCIEISSDSDTEEDLRVEHKERPPQHHRRGTGPAVSACEAPPQIALGLDRQDDVEDLLRGPFEGIGTAVRSAAATPVTHAHAPPGGSAGPSALGFGEARKRKRVNEPGTRVVAQSVGDLERMQEPRGQSWSSSRKPLQPKRPSAADNHVKRQDGSDAASGKQPLTKENSALDVASVSLAQAQKVTTSAQPQDGLPSARHYRWSAEAALVIVQALEDLAHDYDAVVTAMFREGTVSASELRAKVHDLVYQKGKVRPGSGSVSVITLEALRKGLSVKNPDWTLSEAAQVIELMQKKLAVSPGISKIDMAAHLSAKISELRVRGDFAITAKPLAKKIAQWVTKAQVRHFSELTSQGLRGHLPEDINELFLVEVQEHVTSSTLQSVSITGRTPQWTAAEEQAMEDVAELVRTDHYMSLDEAAALLRQMSGSDFTRSARAMRTKLQSRFGGRYGLSMSQDREAWLEAHNKRVAAWWDGLSEEEREDRLDKMHKGWRVWWDGLSEEEREGRLDKMHKGWRVWWDGLSEEGYEVWRLSILQARNQPMRISTRMIDGEERTVATAGWEMRTISWRGMAAEQVFQRTSVALEDIMNFQDDWFLVWGTIEELKAAASEPVPAEFTAMRTRLERYKYQGAECWHRLDHTGFPKTPDTELVLQAQLALLGLKDKQQYRSLVLDACAGTGASLDYNRSLTAPTEHESKCPFQALREKGGLRRMMAKGVGTVQRTGAPYVIEMWSLRTLCICVVNLRRDPRLPASAEPVPVLSVVSLLVDGDDVERVEDEHTSYWHRVIRQLEKSTARTKDPDEREPVIVPPVFDFLLDTHEVTAPSGDVVLAGADGAAVRILPTPLHYSSPLEYVRSPINGTRPPLHHVPGLVERCPTKYDASIERRAHYLDPRTMYAVLR